MTDELQNIAEAELFGDLQSLYQNPNAEILTESCNAFHWMILSAYGERYWKAIGEPAKDPAFLEAVRTARIHYARNAWKLYAQGKLRKIEGDLLSYVDSEEKLFEPELYITLVLEPEKQQAIDTERLREYTQKRGLEPDFKGMLRHYLMYRD